MPDAYRAALIRQVACTSECIGIRPERECTCAPSHRGRAITIAKVQDEAEHGLYLPHVAATVGVGSDELIDPLSRGDPPRRLRMPLRDAAERLSILDAIVRARLLAGEIKFVGAYALDDHEPADGSLLSASPTRSAPPPGSTSMPEVASCG
jgi:hypothetical protein